MPATNLKKTYSQAPLGVARRGFQDGYVWLGYAQLDADIKNSNDLNIPVLTKQKKNENGRLIQLPNTMRNPFHSNRQQQTTTTTNKLY